MKWETEIQKENAILTEDLQMKDCSLSEIMERRTQTYETISQLFRSEVDQPLLDQMHEALYPAHTGNDLMDKGYLLIATYLSNLWENSVSDLSVDYSRVFIGSGLDLYSAAYPYESVYTSEKRLLMQEARDEVVKIYRTERLDKSQEWTEGEDHIALELEFMQILCRRTKDALDAKKEAEASRLLVVQRDFLENHLLSWVPLLTEDMERFAKTDFYQGLACLTEGYLFVDEAFLTDILDGDQA